MALLEGLQSRHEVVPTGNTGSHHALGYTGGDGSLDDGSDGVHGTDYFGLELWGDVELDLLEEVFGGAEAADHEDVLERKLVSDCYFGGKGSP